MRSKFWHILNGHFQNSQSVLKLCQIGEISPNLVILIPFLESNKFVLKNLSSRNPNEPKKFFAPFFVQLLISSGKARQLFIQLAFFAF